MKKRIIIALLLVFAITMFMSSIIHISAADFETKAESAENASSYETHTLFSRLWEYCCENREIALEVVSSVILLAVSIFIKIKNDKKTKTITEDLIAVKSDTSGTAMTQSEVVKTSNELIDAYNDLRSSYEKYQNTEEDRNKLVSAVMIQNTALLEILRTVYVNSKNLPQGVKDIVSLKYANVLKSLDNDDLLKSVIVAVREKIGKMESSASDASEE